ncbi:hypothetical protein FQN54_009615 [Arachnomyces sp. PD_36]|nr:hypothetical protein FQN54_009615 [Arachnomyces sp. PD_36]
MVCSGVNLGTSLHIHWKHNLRLEVAASAQLSLPCLDHVPPTSSKLSEILTSRDTWVSLAPGLKLTVDVCLDGTIRGGPKQASQALGNVGDILEHVDLWSNLNLVASRKDTDTTPEAQDTTRLVYSIQRDLTAIQHSREGKARCSPRGIDETSLKPPDGITTAVLQEIYVTFHFQPIQERFTPTPHPTIKQSDESSDDLLFALDYLDPEEAHSVEIPDAKSQDISPQFPLPTQIYGGYLEESPFSSQESQPSWPRTLQTHKDKEVEEPTDVQPFLMLIDSGLRGLICDKPIRTAAGIKSYFEEPSIKLAEAAPAIFSPRYLSSISQRAGYIPMIAKSISSMLERTKPSNLKERSKELNEAYESRTGIVADDSTITGTRTRQNLKCLLWMSLQRGVFDPGAARRLSRLHTSVPRDGQQNGANPPTTTPFTPNNPESEPMIDISDETFDIENSTSQTIQEDPYDDLLFSELGLHEEEDDEPFHDIDPFSHSYPTPTGNNNDIDHEILDIPASPSPSVPHSPSKNPNSPSLPPPLRLTNTQSGECLPLPMEIVSSSPPLSMIRDHIPTTDIMLSIPDSDTSIPPSSPPLDMNEERDDYVDDDDDDTDVQDMLLS